MSILSLKEFLRLSNKYNVIPVYKQISSDLDTPVSCFLKLKKDKYAFLLESVEGQQNMARYSFLGSGTSLVFKSKGRNIQIITKRKKRKFVAQDSPLRQIKKIMADWQPAHLPCLPRFYGGLVGYLGYDFVRFIEDIPDKNPDDLNVPDAYFILTDTVLAFDHVNHTLKIIKNVVLEDNKRLSRTKKEQLYKKALACISDIQRQLSKPLITDKNTRIKAAAKKIISNFEKSQFCGIVNKAKEYIKKGDIIQVVLSQRFALQVSQRPFDIYRRLRSLNPSPYMFFLHLDEITLIGSSPELLVRCEDGMIQTRPIAGTRKRGIDAKQDKALEQELLKDVKEKAEHLMLVDLGRNDLGKVASLGSVRVSNFMSVERYSHVMHLVSQVSAKLNPKYDAYDVLEACFPAGTVSGSPKVRAMQIIDELENTRRAAYAGCIGYFSFSGAMDTCITIRTILIKNNTAYIQAGAGIVADSVPEKEYQETKNKAKALIEAITQGGS